MESLQEFLRPKLKQLPRSSGVYLFHNSRGEIIYVGKALNLYQRGRSYFQKPSAQDSSRLRFLVENIADLSYIITDSEEEAFILESNLIKEHAPRYNIHFRDDKQYPYLCLTLGEPFPRLEVSRSLENRGDRYFGPYSNAGAVRQTMRLIKKIFPLRGCRQPLQEGDRRGRPCLNYQIKRCLAPCTGQLAEQEYAAVVAQVALFLEGRQKDLLKRLEKEMNIAAENLEFEKAARLRDQYYSLQKIMERQKVVAADMQDRDVIALVEAERGQTVGVFRVRDGKLLGAENFSLSNRGEGLEEGEILKEFLRHYYEKAAFIPAELLLSHFPAEEKLLTEWLKSTKGRGKVNIKVPRRGEKKALLEMVKKNALLFAQQQRRGEEEELSLLELERLLGLPEPPARIEGYDISHFGGGETVGSMVVFWEGKPWKEGYRRFKIRSAPRADDYAALAEMLKRRLHNDRIPSPSLLLVDGGKGQLSAVLRVLEELDKRELPVVALAKEQEYLFLPGEKAPLVLPAVHPALHLLQQVRDEAHRFALSLSRKLEQKKSLTSLLETVPGIGPARRKSLLRHFGGTEELQGASLEELKATPGMTQSAAKKLFEFLRESEEEQEGSKG